ncbi:MAG: YczE/YyaS/YitT family protein [Ilumatobacteraceae bacterium]
MRFLERLARCLFGLACFGTGITLFLQSHLGLPPWDVFHKGVAEKTDISIGTVIIGTGVLLLLLWIPLRQRPGLGTVLNALEIGLVVNLTKGIIGEPEALLARSIMLVGGLLIVAFGSAMYIGAGLGPGPRDGLMMGLAERGVSVRMARTVIEVVVVVVGVSLGGTIGVGTILFAVGIGPLVQLLLPRFDIRPVGERVAH